MYLTIDQSTSSTTIFLFNKKLKLIKKVSKKHKQIYNNKDWVEHNAEEIYSNVLSLIKKISFKVKLHKNLFQAQIHLVDYDDFFNSLENLN